MEWRWRCTRYKLHISPSYTQ